MLSLAAADLSYVPADEIIDKELMRWRFQRLTNELINGALARTTFQPWEVDVLLDLSDCTLPPKRRAETLRQYQKAVDRQLDDGAGPPMMLSEYLQQRTTRRP